MTQQAGQTAQQQQVPGGVTGQFQTPGDDRQRQAEIGRLPGGSFALLHGAGQVRRQVRRLDQRDGAWIAGGVFSAAETGQSTSSMGPTRAVFGHGADYGTWADDQVIALAMIETADGMKNLKEIVSTPGLDGVYIGPADLTLGLTGRKYPTGFDREEPEMIEAIREILARSHEAGIRAALHCGNSAYAAKAIGWGFDMVTLLNDVRLLAGAAKASVDQARKLIGEQVAEAAAPKNAGY